MFKIIIACVVVFAAHYHIINKMLLDIETLAKNASQFNETSHVILQHLDMVSDIVTENMGYIKYLKERVDGVDLHMAALENTIKLVHPPKNEISSTIDN